MKLVYSQPYKKNKVIASWFGKPPKKHFKYDVIKLRLSDEDFWMTPNEALDIIRALGAAVNHWMTTEKFYKKIIKALNKTS